MVETSEGKASEGVSFTEGGFARSPAARCYFKKTGTQEMLLLRFEFSVVLAQKVLNLVGMLQ